jgi:hypothetical protein
MAEDRKGEGRVGRGITDHVFVDVDGTLLVWPTKPGGASAGEVEAAYRNVNALSSRSPALVIAEDRHLVPRVNWDLVEELEAWAARRNGTIVIWTMGGTSHAELAMRCCDWDRGEDAFPKVRCIAKPDVMVDDAKHEKWTARHRVIQPHEFKCPRD